MVEDALELVIWFETQTDCSTYKVDGEVGAAIGWTVRSMPLGVPRRDRGNFGDAARVRRTKRYIDRQGRAGDPMFAGYSFGTKRNGSGLRYTMLNTPKTKHHGDALNEAASEQIGRAVQQAAQRSMEIDRIVYRLQEMKNSYADAHQMDRAFCVHDAITDLQNFGSVRLETLKKARSLAIFTALAGNLGDEA